MTEYGNGVPEPSIFWMLLLELAGVVVRWHHKRGQRFKWNY
ncbi:hypothetical protein [Methylobacillus caricis]|nr:hypothetical protein [Methylobacillus caricis]